MKDNKGLHMRKASNWWGNWKYKKKFSRLFSTCDHLLLDSIPCPCKTSRFDSTCRYVIPHIANLLFQFLCRGIVKIISFLDSFARISNYVDHAGATGVVPCREAWNKTRSAKPRHAPVSWIDTHFLTNMVRQTQNTPLRKTVPWITTAANTTTARQRYWNKV